MKNIDKYKKVFLDSLSINKKNIQKLEYNSTPEWDSIGHMTLISALEDEFKISIKTDDITDFNSFKKGMKILKKYKINF